MTGYSVAHSLTRADTLADELATGADPGQADPLTPADPLRELGLRALLRLDVEGTLEQSIASLTYALEFVRTQDARDDKVRMLRPRHEGSTESGWAGGADAAKLG